MTQSRYLFFVEKAATLLLLIYPMLMLTIKGGMNGVFLFMLLLVFAVWIVHPIDMSTVVWRREWTIYSMAMFAMSAAILISQGFHQNYSAHPYDAASRYWLAIPVFLLLQRLRPSIFTVLQFAFPAAAIAGFLLAKDIGVRLGIGLGIDTLDLIHFGDIELILGMLSLFSINWFGRDKLPLHILKIAGFIAGLAASFASGSRGGWLAIPVFIGIFFYFKMNQVSWRMVLASAVSSTLAIVMAYSVSVSVHQRVNDFANDVAAFEQGNRDTPTGIRWQLYKAALDVFSRHPVSGVGPEGFALEMKPMQEAGQITPAEIGRAHV